MKCRRNIGIIAIIIGIASIFVSSYIKNEVQMGRRKIDNAQGQVDQGKRLFNLAPRESRPISDILTGSAQSRIDEGRMKADNYERNSSWLMSGGIILIVIGIIFLLIKDKKK